jgi:hypothetical protein
VAERRLRALAKERAVGADEASDEYRGREIRKALLFERLEVADSDAGGARHVFQRAAFGFPEGTKIGAERHRGRFSLLHAG